MFVPYKSGFMKENNLVLVNDREYLIIKSIGKGKGGYSFLAKINHKYVTLKQIHHEPCEYYNFGNKIEAELRDYERLSSIGLRMPKLIEVDIEKEIIIKEYIDGEVISELVKNHIDVSEYIEQLKKMLPLFYSNNLNIDYYPTNFVINKENNLIYYIDYECNTYDEKWNFENWGIAYWNGEKAIN